MSATVKPNMALAIEKTLQLKDSRETFTGSLDRPQLYYECHLRSSSFWEDLKKLSIKVFKEITDKTYGEIRRKFTKVCYRNK